MNQLAQTDQNEELQRLEVLQAFKKHFAGKGDANVSPFAEGRVVGYGTDIAPWDVPEVHCEARQEIERTLASIRQRPKSDVIILAGDAGMGKSHLIAHYRNPEIAEKLGYVLVCNSNHWKVNEFEAFILDSMLAAVCKPTANDSHLLLDAVNDIAFQAIGQLLQRPAELRKFISGRSTGWIRRTWDRLFADPDLKLRRMHEKRDPGIFRLLNYARFSSFVCDRFLVNKENPFHKYVMHVLLRYVFPDERELVLHWFRGKEVGSHFLEKLGAKDSIDGHSYKLMDAIKILISVFSPEVARGLNPSQANPGKVFFLAFDQVEGRRELFESQSDWNKFFAQVSELYNTLSNVLILFTMTLRTRDELYPKMERQFRSRIRKDRKFLLEELNAQEILAIYRRRIDAWLGDAMPEIRAKLKMPQFAYLPLSAEELTSSCRQKVLRECLEEMDSRFRHKMLVGVVVEPRFDFLVIRNELKNHEQAVSCSDWTEDHLVRITTLMNLAGKFFAANYGLMYAGITEQETSTGLPVIRMEFHNARNEADWARVFLVRLPRQFNRHINPCVELLHRLQKDRNFLWLIRPDRADQAWADLKPDQVFVHSLDVSSDTTIRSMLRLIDNRDRYGSDVWAEAEKVFLEEFKLTYLGQMFQHVSETLGCCSVGVDQLESAQIGEVG